jgi:hypothetical protein
MLQNFATNRIYFHPYLQGGNLPTPTRIRLLVQGGHHGQLRLQQQVSIHLELPCFFLIHRVFKTILTDFALISILVLSILIPLDFFVDT